MIAQARRHDMQNRFLETSYRYCVHSSELQSNKWLISVWHRTMISATAPNNKATTQHLKCDHLKSGWHGGAQIAMLPHSSRVLVLVWYQVTVYTVFYLFSACSCRFHLCFLVFYQGVFGLAVLIWVSCDGLASHPGWILLPCAQCYQDRLWIQCEPDYNNFISIQIRSWCWWLTHPNNWHEEVCVIWCFFNSTLFTTLVPSWN